MNNLNVLVVDDANSMRKLVVAVLRDMGFKEMFEAENGNVALQTLKERRIDFIITDWKMPGMDGLGLLKAIRSNPSYKDIPILVLTGQGVRETVMEAIENGANNFLVKPFTPATLEKKVLHIVTLVKKKSGDAE